MGVEVGTAARIQNRAAGESGVLGRVENGRGWRLQSVVMVALLLGGGIGSLYPAMGKSTEQVIIDAIQVRYPG